MGNQTADQWNRERWAKRTQRTSPKYERWRPQTATGDKSEQQLHVWCLLNASLSLRHESFCAQQASLTVQRSGSGCPAALFIQFGGGAREGGAAAREPAPYQCVLPLHILRRRCLGPKVKTIPSCTSLPAHFCTVTFTLLFWLVFFSFLFFCFFLLLSSDTLALFPTYPGILSPRSADEMGAVEVWSHVCVRVWLFSWAVPPLSRRVSAVCVAPQQITQRGCVRCRGAFRLLQELWDAGLILNHKLNVNLCTKAWENSLHSQLPLTLQELMCCILCDYFRSTFKYCMICICVHLFIHKSAHMQAYMPVWLVMHIYRYIIKINFIPIFSKSMIFDFMLCTFSPILFPLSVVNRLDRPGRSLPQVPSATVLHSSRRPTATRFWCLSVAAMIVVHVRLQW